MRIMGLNKVTVEYAKVYAQSMAMCLGVYVQAKRGEVKQVGGAIRDSTCTGDLARGVGRAKWELIEKVDFTGTPRE
jgi:hypothetical protein